MSQLVRLGSSPFTIEDSHTLEEIKAAAEENRLEDILESAEILFEHYKAITIKPSALSSIMNGNPLFEQGVLQGFDGLNMDEYLRIYGEDGFIGIGIVCYEEDKRRLYIKVKNIFF
jgi:tRNA pseudouridine55 synthase